VDVDAAIAVSSGPAEAIRQAWQSCRPGGAVELWTVPGGGHAPTISATFPDAALDFLLSHPKP
jgi:threonine dehydrogenase-like Zn-dependent dehydrogenase